MEFDFSSGIANIDPWEIHIPYSSFSQAPCHTPNDYFASLTYAKEYEKQMNNRKEMTEKIINGLTTGTYVLTSCTYADEGYGKPKKIDASFVLPLFCRTPTAKSKTMPIKKVIFNDPATIVFWADGDKTVVKCGENDIFDPEKGLALAISKKFFGNKGKYYDIFKKWLPEEYKTSDTYYADDMPEVTIDYLSDKKKKVILDTFKSTSSNVAERFNNAVYGTIDASDESTSDGTN